MAWLYANYFLPLLAPASVGPSATASRAPLRPLDPLLKTFKTLQKKLVRDASLRKTLAPDIARTLRDVERWVAEARIDAAVVDGVGLDLVPDRGGEETDDADIDPQERWALERLCDALLERGVLVPQSKKYAFFFFFFFLSVTEGNDH
jgi:ribosomal biogenesis protein LAS1